MSSLDNNIVLIALPVIAKKLPDSTPFDLLWVLVGYQLVVSAFLVNIGRLGDMFGRVRLYNMGFAVFTASSLLCSLSQTGDELLIFRLIQGVGAALLFSNSTALITDAFPPQERGRALGINSVSVVVGSSGGLVLGGVLTTLVGWQSIFLVNVPIGVFATVWSHYKLKDQGVRSGHNIDLPGNITFAAALTTILAGITLYAFASVSALVATFLTAGGLGLLILFVFIESRTEDPMLDLSVFKIRMFSGGIIATLLNSVARGAIILVLVFYLESPVLGLDPLQAGLYLLPQSVSMGLCGPIGGYLSDKYGARLIATIGLVISALGLVILTQIPEKVTFSVLALPLTLTGVGVGLFQSPNRSSVMNAVPPGRRGIAGGISSTMLNFGNSVSRSLAFLLMALVLPTGLLTQLFAGTIPPNALTSINSLFSAIHLVYYVSAAILIAAIPVSILRGKSKDFDEDVIDPSVVET